MKLSHAVSSSSPAFSCSVRSLCARRPGAARTGRGRGAQPPAEAAVRTACITPADVQKMFDAYALMQAQEQLKIADEQFTPFLTRFKALQEVRRQTLQARARASSGTCAGSRQPRRSTRRRSGNG